MHLGTPVCSNGTMSWGEAKDYCKKKGGEMLTEAVPTCGKRRGGQGEWLGLRKRWMFKTVSQNTGK